MSVTSMIQNARHTLTVKRSTATKSTTGRPVNTWADVTGLVNVPCFEQQTSASVSEKYNSRRMKVDKSVFLDHVIAVKVGDRVIVNGSTYRVVGTEDLMSKGKVYRIDVEKITSNG